MSYSGGIMGYYNRQERERDAASTFFPGATSRNKPYVVIVNKPKLLGITLNSDYNYITIKSTTPNPYNIINNSKLVSYKHGSNNEVQLENLTGDDLKTEFAPVKQHILNINPTVQSTYVTLTFKSNKDHIPLYPYSVTLKSSQPIGFKRRKGTDINDNDVTIMEIDKTRNPYGITSGSRLVGILYNMSELQDITYDDDAIDLNYFVERKNKIQPDDEKTHITLHMVSTDREAPDRAVEAQKTQLQISGGKSRKTKHHHKKSRRHRKKSRRNKKTRISKY